MTSTLTALAAATRAHETAPTVATLAALRDAKIAHEGCTGTIEVEGLVHEGDRCPLHEDENGRPLPDPEPARSTEELRRRGWLGQDDAPMTEPTRTAWAPCPECGAPFTPGEDVEILQFTDDLYSWDRAWQPATYVSLHGGSDAHIVQTFGREIITWPSAIRKASR